MLKKTPVSDLDSREAALAATELALAKKASDVVILDLRGLTALCDFFVIASGNSDVHVRAVADHILEGLESRGARVWHVEGHAEGRWVLLDVVDVVIHIFDPETRSFYGLERLWGDAPAKRMGDGGQSG